MKLLFINGNYYPEMGGVGTVVQSICENLTGRGHKCTVLTENPNNVDSLEYINGVRIIRVNRPNRFLYGLNYPVWKLIHKQSFNNYDIIHIHGYHTLLSFECAYVFNKKEHPIIFSPHYHGIGHTKLSNFLLNIYNPIGENLMKWAKKVICVSKYEKDLLINDFDIPHEKLQIIPNGVAYLMPFKTRIARDEIRLLYVGALRKYKGLEYILKSLNTLKYQYNLSVKLDIIGKGEDEVYFRNISYALDITENITWINYLSDIGLRNKYIESDILILLSDAEAYGLVVAEALAVGTPCIVSKKAALTEFEMEPGCFVISHPPNINELANLIVRIFENGVKTGPFTDKIRLWGDIAKDYERMYSQCL